MRLVIDGIDLTTLAIPFYVLFMALELLSLRFFPDPVEQGYTVKDTATSLTMGIGSIVCNLGWGLVTVAAVAGVHALAPWHIASSLTGWLVLFVAYDFFYYWEHRANHRVRILWASHVVHHSSRHYNLSTALRQTWTGVGNTIFLLPLALVGFPSYMIFATAAMNLLYQFWIHTERIATMWRPIEFVMNTPSHHRVHHGSNQGYLDKNYGGVFIVFDRLFRSFEPEGEPVEYGLTKNIGTFNPLRVAAHEYAAIARDVRGAAGWRARFGYVLRGPGWSPASPVPATAVTV
ncbi:fatty acid hydroxylase [Catenulispora acidiphila DSM 44928]|uniref:Fatty acid hydroxylase n=1 Tax=Catenulispora acidiphila (strain DSM 44928 / JCM 14897 / NBRC 102108 / NRRL B-24433 / ID139908) TaxID=479433 RepID=C7PVB8_CATAD|nr:fatty acid hydroxylase [Catenulispora acidiphila DSM 44928]